MSKFILSTEEFETWSLPEIDRGQKRAESSADYKKQQEQELARLREESQRKGFEQGYAEGVAKAREEGMVFVARLESLIQSLATPLEQLSDEVEDELVKLAVAVAKQIVRRELKMEPVQVIGVVKEALSALPVASQNIKLHLHPEDAKLVAETLLANVTERKWELVENPAMQRGGCHIETDIASVDATIESRVAAIAARIMGGERSDDS